MNECILQFIINRMELQMIFTLLITEIYLHAVNQDEHMTKSMNDMIIV